MRGLEQIPALYDPLMTVLGWFGVAKWRAWLRAGARGRTLEVGSGTGLNLAHYPELPVLVAVEPELAALEKSRSRNGAALLVRASAEALPFRDGAFDTVVSSLVFCSVPDVPKGLSEVKRVLRDDGQLRMLEHVRSEGNLGGRWQDFIQPAWTAVCGGCHNNRRTEASVSDAGFQIHERRASGTMRRFVATRG